MEWFKATEKEVSQVKRPNADVTELSQAKTERNDPVTVIEEAKSAGIVDVVKSLNSDQKETLDLAITSFLAGVNATLAATKLA